MAAPALLRFGPFQFDPARLELWRDGQPVRLQPQPAQVLATLLARAGSPVAREELRQAVWRDDTFVDFDRGLNFCVAQIRTALGDDASAPRFVRTLPKLGYEFVCPVDAGGIDVRRDRPNLRRWRPAVVWTVAAVIGLMASFSAFRYFSGPPVVVAVVHFDNDTGDVTLAPFIDALTDAVVEKLAGRGANQYLVVGNAAVLRQSRDGRDLVAIGAALRARYIVLGQIQRDDQRVRVLAHLIRLPDQTHVAVSRTDQVEIPGSTLALVDDLAAKIVSTIDATLRNPNVRTAASAASR